MSLDNFDILLIDDDEDDFFHIQDLLNDVSQGRYKVIWKSSYREGLEILKSQAFDACLLDYHLGAQTGIELLQQAQQSVVRTPIILLTGASDRDTDIKAMQGGAADYLVKGQLTTPLLERSIRYSIKHALDMEELRDSKAQILQQDRLASLGLLASSLAHEIGTPMGVIRSRSELALRRGKDNPVLKQDMEIVITQIDRITKLVHSLLNLARTKDTQQVVSVSISEVVSDVLNLLQHEFDRKGIMIVTEIQPCSVQAEAGPLGQVLLNLLINSIHAIEQLRETNSSGVSKISLKVEEIDGVVQIKILDNGCGITSENLPNLFKPFFTTKEVGKGSGLGLATSYKIITSWGGSIEAQSEIGMGTCFQIKLVKSEADKLTH